MEERQVTIDGEANFFPHLSLLATQNPLELKALSVAGAQLDRFR
jgi:MoxR-like ATPase